MNIGFCKKCHKLVRLPGNINIKGSVTMTCPAGHKVKIQDDPADHPGKEGKVDNTKNVENLHADIKKQMLEMRIAGTARRIDAQLELINRLKGQMDKMVAEKEKLEAELKAL